MTLESFIPAGILAATGIGGLAARRLPNAERWIPAACGTALCLAIATLAYVAVRDAPPSAAATDSASSPIAARAAIAEPIAQGASWFALLMGIAWAATAGGGNRARLSHRLCQLSLAVSGVLLAAVASDLWWMLLALVIALLPSTMVLMNEGDRSDARPAVVRSLAMAIVAVALFGSGALMVGQATGSTELDGMHAALAPDAPPAGRRPITYGPSVVAESGCIFLFAGLAIPFLLAPFQLAAAEIFDGAGPWGMGLFVLFARAASLVLMVRILVRGTPGLEMTTQTAFTSVALVSILMGGALCLTQVRVRRLLAFTLTVHGGLVLAALSAGCTEMTHSYANPAIDVGRSFGVGAALFCFVADSLAIVGLLSLLCSLERQGSLIDTIDELASSVRGRPIAAAVVCIVLFSLAGLPPFAGFWSRFEVLKSLLSIGVPAENGFLPHQNVAFVVLALAASAGWILAATGYVRMVCPILLPPGPAGSAHKIGRATRWVEIAAAVSLIGLGAYPQPLLHLAAAAAGRDKGRQIPPESSSPVPSLTDDAEQYLPPRDAYWEPSVSRPVTAPCHT